MHRLGDYKLIIFKAVECGDLAEVKELIANGADVNKMNDYGWTPLMIASQNGHVEILKALLYKGADINAKGKYGITALMVASEMGDLKIVNELLSEGADVNARDDYGWTALLASSKNGNIEVVQALLTNGADLNAKNENSKNALMYAAENNHGNIAEILIKAGSNTEPLYQELRALTELLNNSLDAKAFARSAISLGFNVINEGPMGLHMESPKGHFMLFVAASIHPTSITTLVYMNKFTGEKTCLVDGGKKQY